MSDELNYIAVSNEELGSGEPIARGDHVVHKKTGKHYLVKQSTGDTTSLQFVSLDNIADILVGIDGHMTNNDYKKVINNE